jgi:membrane-associated protein
MENLLDISSARISYKIIRLDHRLTVVNTSFYWSVFAETGLFVGFFFPGDSLLFAAGVFLDKISNSSSGVPQGRRHSIWMAAHNNHNNDHDSSILGNMVGYWFGRKTGPLLYERKETLLFRKKHLVRAKAFYDKYGKGTIFLAKYLPIIRTFAPIVAGMVKMNRSVFMAFNIMVVFHG